MLRRLRGLRSTLALATGVFTAVACSDGTGPADFTIEIVSGDQLQGVAGWQFPELVVRVLDQAGTPTPNVDVRFVVTAGGGGTSRASVRTDALGKARTRWTLGVGFDGTQSVNAIVEAGSLSVTFEATLAVDEADVVVVHGALAPLLGLVAVLDGSTLEFLGLRTTTDTVIHIPPAHAPGKDIVVFGFGNRPLLASPRWTRRVDTVHVTLEPPVAVDLDFYVRAGSLATWQGIMGNQMAAMEAAWRAEGMGLTVGQVTFTDVTTSGLEVDISSRGLCSGLTPGDAIRIDLLTSIDDGSVAGWGCWAGHVFLAEISHRILYLLAHEIGHTFTLAHSITGMMGRSPRVSVLESETFRAHFDEASVLNTIFQSQPKAQQRDCSTLIGCMPAWLDLDTNPFALLADRRAPTLGVVEQDGDRGPVDEVGPRAWPRR